MYHSYIIYIYIHIDHMYILYIMIYVNEFWQYKRCGVRAQNSKSNLWILAGWGLQKFQGSMFTLTLSIYMCTCMTYIYVYVYIFLFIHIYIYMNMCIKWKGNICLSVCLSLSFCLSQYISHIYRCIHIHVTYMYTYKSAACTSY